MKVKVGNKVYDGKKEPVMVILEDQDKENIQNMLPECKKYAMFPEEWQDEDEMRVWMKVEENDIDEVSYRDKLELMLEELKRQGFKSIHLYPGEKPVGADDIEGYYAELCRLIEAVNNDACSTLVFNDSRKNNTVHDKNFQKDRFSVT